MEREHQYLFFKKNLPEYIFFLAGGQEVVARVGGVGGGGEVRGVLVEATENQY